MDQFLGADQVLQRGDEKTVVQAKRYTRNVGVKAVQEAVATKEYYRCDHAIVVTNSYFSRQAATLAKANRVELWNRDDLVSRLLSSKTTIPLQLAASTADLCSDTPELPPTARTMTAPIQPIHTPRSHYTEPRRNSTQRVSWRCPGRTRSGSMTCAW